MSSNSKILCRTKEFTHVIFICTHLAVRFLGSHSSCLKADTSHSVTFCQSTSHVHYVDICRLDSMDANSCFDHAEAPVIAESSMARTWWRWIHRVTTSALCHHTVTAIGLSGLEGFEVHHGPTKPHLAHASHASQQVNIGMLTLSVHISKNFAGKTSTLTHYAAQ